jgi:hypothetical protein
VVSDDGYVLARSGRVAGYLGPCVANTPETAGTLIHKMIEAAPDASFYWDLLPSNSQALAVAGSTGFTAQRHLLRMRRGVKIAAHDQLTYAIAGFELG